MLYVIWAILVFGSLIGRVVLDYQEARSRKKFDQDAKMLMFIAIDVGYFQQHRRVGYGNRLCPNGGAAYKQTCRQ